MKKTSLLLTIACLLLSGCIQSPSNRPTSSFTPEEIAALCEVKRDDFIKLTSIETPKVRFWRENTIEIYRYWLSAEKTDGGSVGYFFTMNTQSSPSRGGAVLWQTAKDIEGTQFQFREKTWRFLSNDGVEETVYIPLNRGYLEKIRDSKDPKLKWRVYNARGWYVELDLDDNFAGGLLQRADAVFGK